MRNADRANLRKAGSLVGFSASLYAGLSKLYGYGLDFIFFYDARKEAALASYGAQSLAWQTPMTAYKALVDAGPKELCLAGVLLGYSALLFLGMMDWIETDKLIEEYEHPVKS